jgi:tripartite-type tricarboxylate transporter receptor subunit TctC
MVPAEVKTVADFAQWAKANPNLANYGIPAPGSAPHFAGMMFERATGIALKSIPYKGGAPLLQDLLGGQIPVAFNVISEVLVHVKSGRLRTLAVTSPQRWAALPDAPTFVELGFKDIVIVEFLGWYAPAKTPPELVRSLNAAIQDALGSPDLQEVYGRTGLVALRESPETFAVRVKDELARWGSVVKATGFSAED